MDVIKMLDQKGCFIRSLESALLEDQKNNCLENIEFECDLENQEEFILIKFTGGGKKRICVTANSNGANAKAILEAIY